MSADLYHAFMRAAKQLCDDLDVNYKRVKLERYETRGVGVSYTVEGKGKIYRFTFHLKTETESSDVTKGKMYATLDIYYSDTAAPFFFHEEISNLKMHPNFLERWTAWAVFNFNLKHNPVNLKSLFHGTSIRVYGLPRYTDPTISELTILLNGVAKCQRGKLVVYRFRHVDRDDKYRSFSYAFLVSTDNMHFYWVFFPQLGGLDSGGASEDLRTAEKLISQISHNLKLERKHFDISYEHLVKFLLEHTDSFERIYLSKPHRQALSRPSEEAFGKDFVEAYSKFEERFAAKAYPQALRDLRALVQHALEITCQKKRIDISTMKDLDISRLSGELIGKNIIDGKLQNWFHAFASIANLASHKVFPTDKDLERLNLAQRIMMTFQLGAQLISELESVLIKKVTLKGTPKSGKLRIKIIKPKPVKKEDIFHETRIGIDKELLK